MKNNNSIYVFFIFLTVSFWNPLTFYLVYRNSDIYHAKILQALFWGVCLIGVLLAYLISKNKIGKRSRDMIFLFSFIGIFFSILTGVNLLFGLTGKKKVSETKTDQGLMFPPGTKVAYSTPEFSFNVNINSLGLRDTEMQVAKTKPRILCFGDSWTFGWGVDVNYSWPKRLNSLFRENGKSVEVVNCGHPGASPNDYKEYLAKTVPVLKPDVVLIGVLQLDDLAQLGESYPDLYTKGKKEKKVSYISGMSYTMMGFLSASFGNIGALLSSKKEVVLSPKEQWKKSSIDYINELTPFQRLRYETFDDTIRNLFETGNLNPGLLPYYLFFPDRDHVFNDATNPITKYAIGEMKKDFADMKKICDENHATLVFLNLPQNTFIGHKVDCFASEDVMNEFLERNNHIDSIYASVAKELNLPYFQLTAQFKALPDKTSYFFKYDTHPTEKGYNELAKGIYQFLSDNNLPLKNQ